MVTIIIVINPLFPRVKVVEELAARCSAQEEQLKKVGSFHMERRQYEQQISRLKSEIDELHRSLGDRDGVAREKDTAIEQYRERLAGVSRTRDTVNACLDEASGAIRTALAFHQVGELPGPSKVP